MKDKGHIVGLHGEEMSVATEGIGVVAGVEGVRGRAVMAEAHGVSFGVVKSSKTDCGDDSTAL